MIKTICTCDRCGIQFPAEQSKTIIFQRSEKARKSAEAEGKIVLELRRMFKPFTTKDYCPECVEEIKKFIETKGERKNERCPD